MAAQLRFVVVGHGTGNPAEKGEYFMTDIDFGELLRAKRKELQLSQEDVATKAGLGLMTYGRIERAEVQPKLEQIRRIFSVLGLQLDAIEDQIQDRLTAAECLNKIEFYVGELRKVMGR